MGGEADNTKAEAWLNEWMMPADALALVTEAMGSQTVASQAIIDQLKDGHVSARARNGVIAARAQQEKKAV